MKRLTGRRAVVTGGTSGIGAAIAERLASEGAEIILTGRSRTRGTAQVQKICQAGGQAKFICLDLTSPGAAEKLAEEAGAIEILVNNAGILFRGNALVCTDDDWDATLTTNISTVFRVSRAFLRSMTECGRGAIVNIASDWALVGAQNAVAYGASKGAVAQLTRSMALDHARQGVRVNAVCPGDTDTSMLDSAIDSSDRSEGLMRLGQTIPMGRVARPAEVAAAVAFLASDDASFITGALLPVDGGNSV